MARILIVDDQESIRITVESILQSKGHVVTMVADPRDAIEKIAAERFDLVISDVVMPGGITGFDLVRTLRTDKKQAHLAILMLTGRREKKDIERAITAGADDYIVKPVDPDILVTKVQTLLDKSASPTGFISCSVDVDARWDVKTKIISVSELGVTVTSQVASLAGSKIKFDCPLFAEIGIDPPTLRVASCSPSKQDEGHFITEAQYIGMTEKSLQPLRLWIRNHKIAK